VVALPNRKNLQLLLEALPRGWNRPVTFSGC
jgi:hypothetical protein